MEFLKLWEIILRRKWIIISVFCIFLFTTIVGTHLITPTYRARALLLVKTSSSMSSMMSSIGLNTGSSVSISSGQSDNTQETNIALATIRPLLEKLISSLNLRDRRGKLLKPGRIKSSLMNKIFSKPYLEVDQYEDTDMLEIASISSSASEAANMSNKLAEIYINDRLGRITEEYTSARIFIEYQIVKVREEYYKSLSDVKNFQIKEGTVKLDKEADSLLNKIDTLKSDYEDNEKTINKLENEISEIEGKLRKMKKFRKDTRQFSETEQIKTLKTKLNDLLISISKKTLDITKEHPEYKELENEIETIRELINKETKVALDSEKYSVSPIYDELSKNLILDNISIEVELAKRRLLQNYIDEYQTALLKIPIKNAESSKLDLSLSVSKDVYQKLLEYKTQVGIAESMTLSDIRLVEAAVVPEIPHSPNKPLNYIFGFFFGLFLGLTLTFFAEYIDNTVKSSEDLKHIKSLALLGTIPITKQLKNYGMISDMDPSSPIVEAFRTVRNSVRYASVDKPIKSFLITSSIEGEGKSSVASNIAISMCREDHKVILVDLDLRKPTVDKFFRASNTKGVTNILVEGLSLEDTIVHSGTEGLDVLFSGPVPPDPSRLIESQRIKDIISTLKERYDCVIIDTPPIMAVNDAIVIGSAVDGLLYLVESGKITFKIVDHVKELIEKAGINLIGVILNKFSMQGAGYYYYYKHRYYKK